MKHQNVNNRININWIDDDDLDYLNYSGNEVYLDPEAIIYRGYDQEYEQVDTLKKYRKDRALFYGSFYSAMIYTYNDLKAVMFPTTRGPVYRFWSIYPLKLYSLNKRNTKYLVNYYVNHGDLVTAARLIYAYGYLQNLSSGYDIVTKLVNEINNDDPKFSKNGKKNVETIQIIISSLESSLMGALNKCMEECRIKNIKGEQREKVLEKVCRQECLLSDNIGRKSQYETDKPLIISLGVYLKKRGYNGIFTPVDKKYSSVGDEIIIFNSQRDLETDNIDVIKQCTSLSEVLTNGVSSFYFPDQLDLDNCPKSSKLLIPKETKKRSLLEHIPYKYRKFLVELYNIVYKHINPLDFVKVADQFNEVFSEVSYIRYKSSEDRIEDILNRVYEKIYYHISEEDYANSNKDLLKSLIVKHKL